MNWKKILYIRKFKIPKYYTHTQKNYYSIYWTGLWGFPFCLEAELLCSLTAAGRKESKAKHGKRDSFMKERFLSNMLSELDLWGQRNKNHPETKCVLLEFPFIFDFKKILKKINYYYFFMCAPSDKKNNL